MSYLNPRDFFLEVARGRTEFSYINKFGANLAVSAATDEDVAEPGGSIVWPTAAETLEILSSSASDKGTPTASTGALTVTIEGLDASWDFKTATVTMDGTAVVAMAGTWRRVSRAYVVTVGSSESNVGIITIRVASAGATRLIIAIGKGQTLHAAWTVPQGYTGYLHSVYGSIISGSPSGVEVTLKTWVRPLVNSAGAWRLHHEISMETDGATEVHQVFNPPHTLPGACDIRIAADVDTDATLVAAGFTVLYATPS